MLAELNPQAQIKFEDFLNRLDAVMNDDKYIVFEGLRRSEKQEAYYAQGREPLEAVNDKRAKVGLYLLSEKENYIITNTLTSKHTLGLAMDVIPVDGRGNPTWDLGHYWDAFCTIRDCGRAAGIICGADWTTFTDWPHFEINLKLEGA
jgi:hypothetical protein